MRFVQGLAVEDQLAVGVDADGGDGERDGDQERHAPVEVVHAARQALMTACRNSPAGVSPRWSMSTTMGRLA